MPESQSITSLLKRLWGHIASYRRGQLVLLLALMICASFAEIVSLGAVLPFLGVLTAPERVYVHPSAQPFIRFFEIAQPDQLLLYLCVVFGLAALFTGAMRILLLWANTRLSYAIGADLSISIYRRTLYQPYAVHVARNSSEIITGIATKTNEVIHIIAMILNLVGSSVTLVAILAALLTVNPTIALTAFGGFGLIYLIIIRITRRRLLGNSQSIAHESTQVIKTLQEGLGGIRDVLIDGSQAAYCDIYRNADLRLRRAQGASSFISGCPRFGMEALGMLLIVGLAYSLSLQPDGISSAIPVLGALAFGAQRFLPVLQLAYVSWSNIQGGQASLRDAIELLEQPLPDYASRPDPQPLPYRHNIRLNQVSFRYGPESPWVLKNVTLEIAKGGRVGFIGQTGSGKSTVLDIVMGLLQPSDGSLEIDGEAIHPGNQRAWQAHVAHVPQAIFLADSTIAENIAFGVPKESIDRERVKRAARQSQIAEIIETWPRQYDTFVGERGVRLSGGQRQRIGIARALYKQADVIIFDEATSALDNETEQAVMQAIDGLSKDLTILIIAHRLTTLKGCTQIIELADCGIKRVGVYQDIVAQPA